MNTSKEIVIVTADGSVILNLALKGCSKTKATNLIIDGLKAAVHKYNRNSLSKQLAYLNLSEQEKCIDFCCAYTNAMN